jgi:hypothetical protein
MEPMLPTEGEFHHFQLVNADGEVPLSISVLVHINPKMIQSFTQTETAPISTDEVLQLHDALQEFDGDFIKAFSKK